MADIPKCFKKVHATKKIAKQEMRQANKVRNWKLTTVYYCSQCKGWHTTSMPKQQSRDFKRYLKNKTK